MNEPSILTVANDLLNSLPPAPDGHFPRGHGFQIHASEPLIFTGEGKERAIAKALSNVGSRLTAEKMHSIHEIQLTGKGGQPLPLGTVTHEIEMQAGKLRR